MPEKAPPLKKFQSNRLKFLLELRADESSIPNAQEALMEQLQQAMRCSAKKLTRLLNNTDQPTIEEMVAVSQVLSVSLDELVKLSEPEAVTA